MNNLRWIKQHGKKAQGRREFIGYLESDEKLSPKKAILANCYSCTGYYSDGRIDCEVNDCPLHPYMPYRKDKTKAKRVLSEKQKESIKKLVSFRPGTRRTTSGKK
jgi:hypothetical protein